MTVERFLEPQKRTHADALAELQAGRKVTHWIWWEMPQLASLGRSPRAIEYGLSDLAEAQAYLDHPTLRARLVALCNALLTHTRMLPDDILGPVDAMKVRSMATLFAAVPGAPSVFDTLLSEMFNGVRCETTKQALLDAR